VLGPSNKKTSCTQRRVKFNYNFKQPNVVLLITRLYLTRLRDSSCEISSLKFDTDGVTLGVGTSTGHCLLYDLRASQPLHIKDHQYGEAIKKIHFHGSKVISADSKIMKIWERSDNPGKVFANIEPPANINDICLIPNTGLLHFACEQSKMLSYFIPELGPAPKWCSFLDSLTVTIAMCSFITTCRKSWRKTNKLFTTITNLSLAMSLLSIFYCYLSNLLGWV
jgi:hypothetical protein